MFTRVSHPRSRTTPAPPADDHDRGYRRSGSPPGLASATTAAVPHARPTCAQHPRAKALAIPWEYSHVVIHCCEGRLNLGDHSTIAEFRRRQEVQIAGLFDDLLALCAEAGLVSVGAITIGGTKIEADGRPDAGGIRVVTCLW